MAGTVPEMSTVDFSIVIPVYNEPEWLGVVVNDLAVALQRSAFAARTELVLVDDGSDQATRDAIERLDGPFPIRVVRQENAGRFVARRTGIEAAAGETVMLIDSRVSIGETALGFVADEVAAGRRVWNAHVDIELRGNPFARFWNVLTELAFREYFGNPRTTSFGLEEFDRFPKGTTCFLAPRELLLGAISSFESAFEDPRDANDDTILIRWIAKRERINISPSFNVLYRSRDALRPFLRHAYHRGGVFVDGYGRPGTRFFPAIAAFFPISVVAAVVAVRRPRAATALAAAAPLGAGSATFAIRRSFADAVTLAWLTPLFACVYGAGMWRGLGLAIRARYGPGRAGRPR